MSWTPRDPAVVEHLTALRREAQDRPAQQRFLTTLEQIATEGGADVATRLFDAEPPAGVTSRIAEALVDDLTWLVEHERNPGPTNAPYPRAYVRARMAGRRAAAARAETLERNITGIVGL